MKPEALRRLQESGRAVEIEMSEVGIQSQDYRLQGQAGQALAGARKLLPLKRVNSNKGTDEEFGERREKKRYFPLHLYMCFTVYIAFV